MHRRTALSIGVPVEAARKSSISRIDGNSEREPRLNVSMNSRDVPKRNGLPGTSFFPITFTSRRSIKVFNDPAQSTPRICSISCRVSGCL